MSDEPTVGEKEAVDTIFEGEAEFTGDEGVAENGDTPSTISVPQSQLDALLNKITDLETEMGGLKLKQSQGMTPRVEQLQRAIARTEAEEFLASTRPKSEFWSFNYLYWNCLFPGGVRVDAHGIKQRLPSLSMKFTEWRGPGSEFPNPNNTKHLQRQMMIGRCQIHMDPLVAVTEADMTMFGIPTHLPNKPHAGFAFQQEKGGGLQPLYPLGEVLERIMDDPECGSVFMTGDYFQAILQTLYETRWFEAERQKALQIKLAGLQAGAEKTGRVDMSGLVL